MSGPLARVCPLCGAPAGERCLSPQGVPYASGYVHPEREWPGDESPGPEGAYTPMI